MAKTKYTLTVQFVSEDLEDYEAAMAQLIGLDIVDEKEEEVTD